MSVLEVKDLSYSVEGNEIIKGINWQIEKGECISLIGTSGSGKSTLLKLCADLISPTKGELFYAGENYIAYDPLALKRKISYCVQLPYLFGETVYDNLAFPFQIRKDIANTELMVQRLMDFGLKGELLHQKIEGLSGGEKQRVALARNLMYEPEILLLDEATASLDSGSAALVETYIKKLNKSGVTVLWITHNLEQSKGIFNKRLTMSYGEIIKEEVIESWD